MGKQPIIALVILIGLAGCQQRLVDPTNPCPIDAGEYDCTFAASVEVLREHGFRINRQDHRFGRITTRPVGSPTAFEPWINHNSTRKQTAISTLAEVHRVVTITLEPAGQAKSEDGSELGSKVDTNRGHAAADHFSLTVEVLMQRRAKPTRRLDGSASRSLFAALRDSPEEWKRRGIGKSHWLPIGRDPEFETRVIRDILRRCRRI